MNKLLAAVFVFVLCTSASAGTVMAAPNTPIITPDVATDFQVFEWKAMSPNGYVLICPNTDMYGRGGVCRDDSGNNRWMKIRDAVPKGRTYAGFTITYQGSVIVYWR